MPATMSAIDAIGSLDEMMAAINAAVNDTADESHRMATQWDALRNLGAARDDHAAQMLANVRRKLDRLHKVTGRCLERMDAVIANPFGD